MEHTFSSFYQWQFEKMVRNQIGKKYREITRVISDPF